MLGETFLRVVIAQPIPAGKGDLDQGIVVIDEKYAQPHSHETPHTRIDFDSISTSLADRMVPQLRNAYSN
jgi:hypothetical protein